ncbi:hypothetical protein BH10PSE18_BH10PSE18_29850 [soil metagenome]
MRLSLPADDADDVCPAEAALADADAVIARLLPLIDPSDTASMPLQEHLASAWFNRIEALRRLDRSAEIPAVSDALCAHFEPQANDIVTPVLAQPAAWPWIARALCEKAMALGGLDPRDRALTLLQDLQQRFRNAQSPALRQWVAVAGLEEAMLRASASATSGGTFAMVDMVRHCQDLIDRFGHDDWPATRVVVARTRAWQARLLSQLGYHDEALVRYTALHGDLLGAAEPTLKEQGADALHAKARLLDRLDRKDEASAALQTLVEACSDAVHPGLRQTLALAQADQLLHLQRERPAGTDEADHADGDDADADTPLIDACDALLASHEDSIDTVVLRCVNQAMRMKADLLRERDGGPGGTPTADALTDRQWARYADHPDAQIQREVVLAMLDKLWSIRDPDQRLAGCRLLLARFGDSESELLQVSLARARLLEARALCSLDRDEEALAALDAMPGAVQGSGTTGIAPILPDGLRETIARAMDLRADIWNERSPEAHPRQSGRADDGAPIEVAVAEAEVRYAEAVEALCARFSADPLPHVRTIAANALYDLAVHWRERLHFTQAVDAYAAYLRTFAADTTSSIEPLTAMAWLNQGYTLMMLMDREADALIAYDSLIARFANATSADMRDTLAKAAASRLTCLNRLQRQGVAVDYGAQYEDLSLAQRDAISATIERGRVLAVAGKHREAIACYDEVLEVHVESLHPELRRQCLDAMVRKGYSLGQLAQREAALAVNDEIIARYGDELSTTVEKDVALAMSNRAVQLDMLGRHDEEVQTYDRIIARWHGSSVAYLRQRVASARYCKAITIADTDLEGALSLYEEVMRTSLHAPEAAIRLEAAKSAVNRSIRLRRAGRYDEAVACAETLLQACGTETDTDIAAQVVKVRIGLARAYGESGQTALQIGTLASLLALPGAALTDAQRNELSTEYRQAKPAGTAIGKAAHALGSWFGRRK